MAKKSPINLEESNKMGLLCKNARYHRLPKKFDDDYETKDKVLGTGLNGVVKMGVGKGAQNPQQYAIKALKLSGLNASAKQQLESEVDVFLAMDHPHVARLFDVYESNDMLHLVMECMTGGELFDRVQEKKRFREEDAAEAVRQMLRSISYLHSKGIVHRDLKLENFLYDQKGSDHLKLIDFGFSKVWDPNTKLSHSCGTLSYVAPEVLRKSYTNQCDLWSLGVITFILLAGYMPFSGQEKTMADNIARGVYTMKPERWKTISNEATEFVKSLMTVDPNKRLTAERALQHPWVEGKATYKEAEIDQDIVSALQQFGQASKFRRAALSMMAWSLSNEERAQVRDYFVAMDQNKQGTITLGELKRVMMDKYHLPEGETMEIFNALDSNNDETIHYSDFLAAMVSNRIGMHGDLLKKAFSKFDTDNSGYITVANLHEVLGSDYQGEEVEKLINEADLLHDGRVSYEEFVAYLRGTPMDPTAEKAALVIDNNKNANREQRQSLDKTLGLRQKETNVVPNQPGSSPKLEGDGNKQCCVVS
jgi:serine/threonine protein kinase